MKKGLLAVLLVLGVAASAAAGTIQKKSSKQKFQAKADTSLFNLKSDRLASLDRLMEEMPDQSRYFFDNAMEMLNGMPVVDFSIPASLDSIIERNGDAFSDTTDNRRVRMHRGMVIPRPKMHGKRLRQHADSLCESQSIMVFSDGKTTTIIKNGKDTTIVDGPMNGIMDGFDMPVISPMVHPIDPRVSFDEFDDDMNVQMRPRFNGGQLASEAPSVQEMDMLVGKGIVSAKEVKKALEVQGVNIIQNRSGNTFTVVFRIDGAEQCELQVVTPDGVTIEKSTIAGNQGRFRRTVKITPNQDYVYVVVARDKKSFVSKFWL